MQGKFLPSWFCQTWAGLAARKALSALITRRSCFASVDWSGNFSVFAAGAGLPFFILSLGHLFSGPRPASFWELARLGDSYFLRFVFTGAALSSFMHS